jgi:hypothetical protein
LFVLQIAKHERGENTLYSSHFWFLLNKKKYKSFHATLNIFLFS